MKSAIPRLRSGQECKVQSWDKGVTLIEVLVAMSIVTVAGVLLLVIIVNSAGLFSQQSSKVETGLSINDAISAVSANIKQASNVATSYTDGATTYTSSGSQLVLKVPSLDVVGNIIANTFDYFVFFKDQNFLRFKIFPDPLSLRPGKNQILSNSLDSLYFQYLNWATPPVEVVPASATKIRITLTLKQKAGAGFEVNTATSEANLRND